MHSTPYPRRNLDPNLIKPILRAYALGYITTTGPRILSFLRILRRRDLTIEDKAKYLARALAGALGWNRFPTFCALLVAGSSFLQILSKRVLNSIFKYRLSRSSSPGFNRLLRFTAIFLSGWFCFPIINSRRRPESQPNAIRSPEKQKSAQLAQNGKIQSNASMVPDLAGRTLDLTLFAAVRAVDVVACVAWARWKRGRKSRQRLTHFESVLPQLVDSAVFAASSGLVMWAWFYIPERLPYSYARWISDIAEIDLRIIKALRTARQGKWTYGKPKDHLVLEPACEDHGWPREWGDTTQTVPIPCELVHMGRSPNCEVHAIWRFFKAFKFVFTTELPIQLVLRSRSPSISAYFYALKTSIRSSVFLGLFVSIFYYSVCLARTRIGPKLFSRERITPMMWDSGLCVAAGCIMCGWSILVENPKKRQEVALFVAPRAAATLLPRRYDRKHQWRENAVFSLSTAIVLTCIQEDPKKVRGVFGKVLGGIFKR